MINNINNLKAATEFFDTFSVDESINVFKEKLIKLAEKELYFFYSKHMSEIKNIKQLRIKAIYSDLFKNWIENMCWENKFVLMYFFSLQNTAKNFIFNTKNKDVIGEFCRQFLINEAYKNILMG